MPQTMLMRRLRSLAEVSKSDEALLSALPVQIVVVPKGQDIARKGNRSGRCAVILEGWACQYQLTEQGHRQIVGFCYPGDIPDLQNLYIKHADTGVSALIECRIATFARKGLQILCEENPQIARLFWHVSLTDGATYRQWLTNIGQRDAWTRTAHLLCEIYMRRASMGCVRDKCTELPITQIDLADALGLSQVHLNRVLGAIRRTNYADVAGGILSISDWETFSALAGFDPAYLQLEQRPEGPQSVGTGVNAPH